MKTATKKISAINASNSAVFSFGDTISIYLTTGGVSKEW
jgi:hypothetical protein